MIKNILQVYALLVCLITVIILIVTLSISLNTITNLLIPEYKYNYNLRQYDSNDDYIQHYKEMGTNHAQTVISLQQLPPSQLAEKRTNERARYLKNQRASNIGSLIESFQWILVAMIFFFIHWKLYKKSEKQSSKK